MANHLEDLVAEWLEYNGYFVRKSVLVDPRPNGGFNGELDVVAFSPGTGHLLHVECSLDALSWDKREVRFSRKLELGRRWVPELMAGFDCDDEPDQVVLLQFGGGSRSKVGGGRLMWVDDFVSDVLLELQQRHPSKQAVPSTFPLLRTLQLAACRRSDRKSPHRLIAESA